MAWRPWIQRAERFRQYARQDLEEGRYDSAAFYSQQSAELLLKGILIKLTGFKPITHSTSELLSLLEKAAGAPAEEDVRRCAEELEEHYVQARYPDARINDYREWEAERAVECMETIWRYAERYNLAG